MRLFRKRRRGATIIEMLVTIFVFSMIMTIVTAMFFVLLQTYNTNDAQAQLIGNASSIQTSFLADINGAYGILPTTTVGGTAYTSGQNAVVLRIASLDEQGDLIVNTCDAAGANPCDTAVIAADPNDASRLLEVISPNAASSRPAATKLLTGSLDQYVFTYRNADAVTSSDVTLTLTLVKAVARSTITHTFRIHGKLRNT